MTYDMSTVLNALAGKRFPLEDEKATQEAIGEALHAAFTDSGKFVMPHPTVRREVRLSNGQIIDFLVGDPGNAIGVEVKIKGQATAIRRQLCKQIDSGDVSALVLATSKAVALPEKLHGRPLVVFDMARAWL